MPNNIKYVPTITKETIIEEIQGKIVDPEHNFTPLGSISTLNTKDVVGKNDLMTIKEWFYS